MYSLQIEDLPSLVDSPIEVKLSGDGAPFSRVSPYILLSFSFPSLNEKLSSEGTSSYFLMTKILLMINFLSKKCTL